MFTDALKNKIYINLWDLRFIHKGPITVTSPAVELATSDMSKSDTNNVYMHMHHFNGENLSQLPIKPFV